VENKREDLGPPTLEELTDALCDLEFEWVNQAKDTGDVRDVGNTLYALHLLRQRCLDHETPEAKELRMGRRVRTTLMADPGLEPKGLKAKWGIFHKASGVRSENYPLSYSNWVTATNIVGQGLSGEHLEQHRACYEVRLIK
jgi:hypothetical protein